MKITMVGFKSPILSFSFQLCDGSKKMKKRIIIAQPEGHFYFSFWVSVISIHKFLWIGQWWNMSFWGHSSFHSSLMWSSHAWKGSRDGLLRAVSIERETRKPSPSWVKGWQPEIGTFKKIINFFLIQWTVQLKSQLLLPCHIR